MQELSATEREPMTTCMNFYPCCSFQCYFDTYCVCFLGSGNWLHLRLYLLLRMTTLKYVPSLITPVEGSGQDIHCESHTIQEQESLGFSGFHFYLFDSFGLQKVLCLYFTGWSRCQRCQRSSWRSRSKGTLYSTLRLSDAQALGLSLLHVNHEMNPRFSTVAGENA